MYEAYYGLRELPFELTPNPKYLYLTARHREALSNLEYGLSAAKPVTVLLGEAGTGKTTLIRAALGSDRCRRVRCVYLNNPALTREEFVETLARSFQLGADALRSKSALLSGLESTLRCARARGTIAALVIDEAQSMSAELLEEVRLLANLETSTEKLLPLVLAGQPELAARLNAPGFRQFKQRIALRCELVPFALEETADYIVRRIHIAGGNASSLFTQEALLLIHNAARGIPRSISVLCDNALLTGMALGRQRIDSEIVREVCQDFDVQPSEPEAAPPAAATEPGDEPIVSVSLATPAPGPQPAPAPAVSSHVAESGRWGRRFTVLGLTRP